MSEDYRYMSAEGRVIFWCEQYNSMVDEVKRLRSGMQDILDDFETTKTDMWSIIKRIQEMIE